MTLRAVFLATAMMTTSAAALAELPAPEASVAVPAADVSSQAPAAAAPASTPSQPGATAPAAAAAAATPGTPAAAASAKAEIASGAAVLDAQGGAVGTIASVSGDIVVIDTGSVKASVPVASLAKSDKGVLIGMTKTELEAAARGVRAEVAANLAPGTAVVDANGGAVGTIEAVSGDTVTVATPNVKAQLPKASFAIGPNGGAMISMTQAQLEAAAQGQSPAS